MSNLYQQVYAALRTQILAGELAPGARLVEERLARQLSVSRTPIREAIRQLQHEGLIQADDRGGLRVTVVSIADAIHLYDCRMGLEQVAAVGACENANSAQIEDLQDCLARARTLAEGKSRGNTADLVERLTIDRTFHCSIAASAGNPWLLDLLDRVFDKMTLLRLTTTYRNPQVLEIWQEHEEIVAAIVRRDPPAAALAVRNHLIASKARVVEAMQGFQADVLAASLVFD